MELCIVMEYADGGDLSAKVEKHKASRRNMDEGAIWAYLIQLLDGLHAIHSKKIVHRGRCVWPLSLAACRQALEAWVGFRGEKDNCPCILVSLPCSRTDIKTANCFLTSTGHLKIGDMNVSKLMKAGFLKTQIGTPYYMSPEIFRNKPYDTKSDMWSLGCVLYELCALRVPFRGNDIDELSRKVQVRFYHNLESSAWASNWV
jgi:NIMA (never in mitosis gene a)-related kinase